MPLLFDSAFAGSMVVVGLLAGSAALLCRYWERLFGADSVDYRSFWVWMLQGVWAPLTVWLVLNLGWAAGLPPLSPMVHSMRANGEAVRAFLMAFSTGGFLIGSCWAAMTLGWMVSAIGFRTSERADFIAFGILGSLIFLPVSVLIGYFGGWFTLGLAGFVWLLPIVHFTVGDARRVVRSPSYSRAIARIKFGKYEEAEMEVIRQLEKREEDFDGWVLLAELYAKQFNDLPEADRLIRDVCTQPNVPGAQIALALNRLAEWHLKIGSDPDAACDALVYLCRLLPHTHFSRMAQLRISQLPATRQEWEQAQQKKTSVQLRPAAPGIEEPIDPLPPHLTEPEALSLVNDYVQKLREDPNNVAARERFAVVAAERLGQPDVAIDQLELLLQMPEQPENKMAEWLALIASWHYRFRSDLNAATAALQRLVRDYPQSPQAFSAQRSLNLFQAEERMRRARAKTSR